MPVYYRDETRLNKMKEQKEKERWKIRQDLTGVRLNYMPAYGPDPKLDSLSSRGMNIALSHEWEMAPGRGGTPMGNYEFNRIINGAVCALRRCRWRRPRGYVHVHQEDNSDPFSSERFNSLRIRNVQRFSLSTDTTRYITNAVRM